LTPIHFFRSHRSHEQWRLTSSIMDSDGNTFSCFLLKRSDQPTFRENLSPSSICELQSGVIRVSQGLLALWDVIQNDLPSLYILLMFSELSFFVGQGRPQMISGYWAHLSRPHSLPVRPILHATHPRAFMNDQCAFWNGHRVSVIPSGAPFLVRSKWIEFMTPNTNFNSVNSWRTSTFDEHKRNPWTRGVVSRRSGQTSRPPGPSSRTKTSGHDTSPNRWVT
jgi:hypothetical protein